MSSDSRAAGSAPSTVRVELFVRSLAPGTARSQQENVVERLQRLAESGALAAFDIHVTGGTVCPSTAAADSDTGRFLCRRIDEFEAWAEASGRTLVGVERREEGTTLTGESTSGVRLPQRCLAEFVDGDLRFVAPSAGAEMVTVADRVDDLVERLER